MIFPHYTQPDAMDCGPTCLRMVAAYHGKHYSLPSLREKSHITREGVSLPGISDAAEAIGFRTMGVKISFGKLCWLLSLLIPAGLHICRKKTECQFRGN
jgi:ATP-binding cassette subfamily B protein